jgi:D-glycero-alpha-D-manno-heptose-7-phosphate kinase
MNKVTVRAPVRADLAGGTLDLWPIYLFHPGSRTVNVAISFYAESEVSVTGDGAIEIHLTDQQYRQRYESMGDLAADPKAALVHRALEHFHIKGVQITTRTDAPRGSGLGGSSALTITLVRALSEIAGKPVDGDDLIFLVRDLETRLLGVPAGIQDYYPPVYGGLAALHLEPGVPVRRPIAIPIHDLASHFLLHYTGVAHFSGTNNWEMYKRQIEGKKKIQKGFAKIAQTSVDMERALGDGDFKAAGAALGREWQNRKALIDGISTPEIDTAIEAAVGAGAWAGKVCGAGGGGCVVFLLPPEKRAAVREALANVPGRVLDVAPVAHGMVVSREDDTQATLPLRARTFRRRTSGAIEQLYVSGSRADYRPYLLAEAIVTHNESRSGTRHAIARSYVAPVADDGSVEWQVASQIDVDKLEMRTVPEPDRNVRSTAAPEALIQAIPQTEDAFKQFLSETEHLRIYQNSEFGLFSTPDETKQAFIERCLEEAQRRLDEETERLESTFRRRIDQVKERSEKDQREIDSNEETPNSDGTQEVNVAWGQALYNITSGRPAAVAESPQSVREVDYLEKIAQIQKAWDRELEAKREGLIEKARAIEEIEVVPAPRDIEVTKYVILWAAGLGDTPDDDDRG